jgi:transposase
MPKSERGRFSAKRKREAVLRLLRGEDLDLVSRELGVTGATLAQWREAFLEGGLGALRSKAADDRDERIKVLEQKLGQVVLENELLNEKIDSMEGGHPLALRRSRR